MEKISQPLLTFLLNAVWQVALISLVATLTATILRGATARVRHRLWVVALGLCVCMPAFVALRSLSSLPAPDNQAPTQSRIIVSAAEVTTTSAQLPKRPLSSIPIGGSLAAAAAGLYLGFLIVRAIRLAYAWRQARSIIASASTVDSLEPMAFVVARCREALAVPEVRVLSSPQVHVPMTFGSVDPVIVVPERLLHERDVDVLTAAIGHEFVHVSRGDYARNLIYELIYLPISFHPAAALIRRRIRETRELSCDEMVADRLLDARVYARSIVELVREAMAGARPIVTVGIADADILEVRVMELLRMTDLTVRRTRLWMIVAAILLAVPCVAAGTYGFRFNIKPAPAAFVQQTERREPKMSEAQLREQREIKERAERDPQFRAELEERQRHLALELEARDKEQAELARVAKISMDQAIQTALTQQPGKVIECNLVGEHWEAPGKLAADGEVFYHVVVFFTGDDAKPVRLHILVNAIDGNIMRSFTEEPLRFKTRINEGFARTSH